MSFFIIPTILTFLFFWIFPYFSRIFFRKNIKNQKALKVIELQERKEEKKEQKELVKQETALIKEEIIKAKEEKKAERETPELLWEKEFNAFQKNRLYSKFKQILHSIYAQNGNINDYNNTFVNEDMLAHADSTGLITIHQKEGKISLTEKGKFFVRRFSEDQNQQE